MTSCFHHVAWVRRGVGNSVAECVGIDQLACVCVVNLWVVEEGRAIGHQKLQVPDLWGVDVRVVEFGEDPGGNREPYLARAKTRQCRGLVCRRGPRMEWPKANQVRDYG